MNQRALDEQLPAFQEVRWQHDEQFRPDLSTSYRGATALEGLSSGPRIFLRPQTIRAMLPCSLTGPRMGVVRD